MEEAEPHTSMQEEAMQSRPQPIRILLVEDNPMDERLLYAFLEQNPDQAYEIAHATTLAEGMAHIEEHPVDIILLDLFLPDSEGLGTFSKLHDAFPKLPVVLLTSLSDEMAATEAVRMGAQDYMVKWEVNASLIWKSILYGIERMRLINALVKSRQREREASEARFRKIIEENADGIVIVAHDGRVRYLNPAAEALFSLQAEQFVGRAFPYPISAGRTQEIEIAQAEDEPVFVEMHVVESQWEHEAVLLASLRNMTERRKAEQALRDAMEEAEKLARLKSSFLANMSHEIRTPLTSVLGFASVLAEEVQDEQHRSFIQMIERSGRRLMETLNSVLDLAKLEMRGMNPARVPVNLIEKAGDVVELMRPLALQKNLELVFRPSCRCPSHIAYLDEGCFVRILQNLVSNAIKFTDTGSVEVGLRCGGDLATLEVRDSGVGISEAFMPRLYDAFQQESMGLSRSHEGSGLGLTITKRLVDILGGRIEVESEKGVGSSFRVLLPLSSPAADDDETAAETTSIDPAIRGRPHILVVDDEVETLMLIRHILAERFKVDTATTSAMALDLVRRQEYDALLLDINLQNGETGTDLLPLIRNLPLGAELPVVASTALALPGDRERLLAVGFDAYLPKPFVKHELVEAILSVLPSSAAPNGDGVSVASTP